MSPRDARRLVSMAAVILFALFAQFASLPATRAYGAGGAAVSPEATDAPPEVTVVAPKWPNPKDVPSASVFEFISAHGRPAVVTHQLARWYQPVCPTVSGLSKGFDDFIRARILAVAASVGAPHGKLGHCEPNVQIVFSTDAQALVRQIAAKDSSLLGFHYPAEEKRASTFTGPIQGWYVTATQGDSGGVVLDDPMPMKFGDPRSLLDAANVPSARIDTRLATGLSSLLMHALLIANTKQVVGQPVGAVSDYLAVMVLSPEWLSKSCGALPSIADLMATGCANHERPQAITAADIAYLRALYRQDLRRQYSLERSVILDDMMRQFSAHR